MGNAALKRPQYYCYDELLEWEPMLGSDRLQNAHDRIEIEETPPQKFNAIIKSIRQRFTFVYVILGLVLLIALAVLVVSIMLLCSMKKLDHKYKNMTLAGSERFMRLYETVSIVKSPHRNLSALNDVVRKLSPEQLAQARAFGLLPKEQSPEQSNMGEPIRPVLTNGGYKNTDQDLSMPMASLDDLPEKIRAEASDFYNHSWFESSCSIQCKKTDITIPPLVVISLDGFVNDYLKRKLVPSLEKLGECGAKAKYMYPSYPSKTFPNHYSIATGLYPESHGIVDKCVFDPTIGPNIEDVRRTNKTGYFKGVPIWSEIVRQRRRMFCLMWPGCSVNITNHNPTINIPYNRSMSYSARVDTMVNWLELPAEQRPDLIMAYFDQPDTAGHFRKTDAEVNLELIYIESVLNYFLTSLKRNNLLDCINLVVLSDHGMEKLDNRVYMDSLKVDIGNNIFVDGVVSRIHLTHLNQSIETILDSLKCLDNKKFNVYDRKQVPTRYHFASERTGDVIIESNPNTIIFKNKESDYDVLRDHGYDYIQEKMHAIFFARGPNIRPQTVVDPFQNIELFNLFAELLRIKNDVPNNGTDGALSEILYNINSLRVSVLNTSSRPLQECDPIAPLQRHHLKSCFDSRNCQASAQTAHVKLYECPLQMIPSGLLYTNRANYCFINLCSVLTAIDLSTAYGVPTIAYETLTQQDFVDEKSNQVADEQFCSFNDLRFEPSCDNWTAMVNQKSNEALEWTSLLVNYDNELMHYNRFQFLLYKQFLKGPFGYLQNLTRHYAKTYSRLLVFTGAVYDFDMNGIGDDLTVFWNHISNLPDKNNHKERAPSHIVRVLMRCADGAWHINGVNCKRSSETRVLAFVLPNVRIDLNCLKPNEYLLKNSARVRDVELLTGVFFFYEKMWYPERDAIRWRLNITEELWP